MEQIKEYSTVLIRAGTYESFFGGVVTLTEDTQGGVIEVYGDQQLFTIDLGEIIDVKREDIIRALSA